MADIQPGTIFGEWTVLQKTENRTSDRNVLYLCRCSCGIEREVASSSLRQGKSKSCGHARMRNMTEARKKQCEEIRSSIIGKRFGRLVVTGLSDKKDQFNHKFVTCKCDCGSVIETTKSKLESGHTSSCGCIKSKGEEKISEILTNLEISFSKEVRFTDCRDKKPLPFDFGLYWKGKLKGLIEYNGNIHYEGFHSKWDTKGHLEKLQKHDRMKVEYCKRNNIPLLVIPYTEQNIRASILEFWNKIGRNFND